MNLLKSPYFKKLAIAGALFFSQQLFAGQATLKCSSEAMGRDVVVIGTQSYLNTKTSKEEPTTTISVWIPQLEKDFLFTNIRYNTKKAKYLAKRNIYNFPARVTIESQKNKIEITYNGIKTNITDAKCTPVYGE